MSCPYCVIILDKENLRIMYCFGFSIISDFAPPTSIVSTFRSVLLMWFIISTKKYISSKSLVASSKSLSAPHYISILSISFPTPQLVQHHIHQLQRLQHYLQIQKHSLFALMILWFQIQILFEPANQTFQFALHELHNM